MFDRPFTEPPALARIREIAKTAHFEMSSEPLVGSLLATLAASKPGGTIVEIGTGIGAGTSWLLAGMDENAHLTTIDISQVLVLLAQSQLRGDHRVEFVCADAAQWLDDYNGDPIDLAFVDWRNGKFEQLDRLIELLAPGGLYVVDDLLPQPTWPEDHEERIAQFWNAWPREDMVATPMAWASGLLIGTKLP
jgi:predicted O-methyltransferase YrrM